MVQCPSAYVGREVDPRGAVRAVGAFAGCRVGAQGAGVVSVKKRSFSGHGLHNEIKPAPPKAIVPGSVMREVVDGAARINHQRGPVVLEGRVDVVA
jgi:hypothetical protein